MFGRLFLVTKGPASGGGKGAVQVVAQGFLKGKACAVEADREDVVLQTLLDGGK